MGGRLIYGDFCATVLSTKKDTHVGPEALFYSGSRGGVLLQKFSEFPSDLLYRRITNAELSFRFSNEDNTDEKTEVVTTAILREAFDPNTVTYNTQPQANIQEIYNVRPVYLDRYTEFQPISQNDLLYLCKYGIRVKLTHYAMYTSAGVYPPAIFVEYDDTLNGLTPTPTFPANGATISRSLPTTFSWTNNPLLTDTLETPYASSVKFRWRVKGQSTYTEKAAGSVSITIPANTFSTGGIEWQVEVTANTGTVSTSEWTAAAVMEPVPSAVIVSPQNAVVDGAASITFSWKHVIANGTDQTAFDLQTSRDGEDWSTLRSASTSNTLVVIPANTFTAGDLYWRVRTYNLDNVASSWSEVAHIVVIAAPAAPGVTVVKATPRFLIRWQQTGQQAYEIMLDNAVIEKQYGLKSTYQYDGYLPPNDQHTIKVRIQNKYGLWSKWGVLSLNVENVPGPAITLTASGNNPVVLSWTGSAEYDGYVVYRNGVKLSETTETQYVDDFALGDAEYQVRGFYAGTGYYTLSNAAAVNVTVDAIQIADVNNPVWLPLDKSTSSLRATSASTSKSVSYFHYVGAQLPGAEIGEAVDTYYQLNCAWKTTDHQSIAAFEALFGKVVCVKTPSGRRIIGVFGQHSRTENRFVVSYSVQITLIDWEEG